MRVFKNSWFQRFAKKEGITDEVLLEAVTRAEQGLIDADLGGGVIKQRIAKQGKGKSSGYRSIIIFKKGDKAFFVFGFPKNQRQNISEEELAAFKKLAKEVFKLSDELIVAAIANGTWIEVSIDE
ncbi:hypothetical protein Glo7428_4104 [Gloeocapsa sp. PCC 7428]|uniref:type II toxin-antitoxin system RelE/ParE family toxin n=1 Tax=Gloeocapsa sp. PCC 7428 TaxID=1173026 RepID=UPI0002A5E155|nr:type II toxin-antitoxin system RelE/ParE family toxin [Gloeocapsa sp. PCC 7428]AFZ32553.1 hypothetical protein Glo7428_4104 [Gloeocapsa sp. PCC 7428]